MWSDANVNYTQQRIIKKHLWLHFGRRLFIPDTKLIEDNERYYVPTSYGNYKYYKNGDKSQKPEKCSFWCRDPSLVVANELTRMLEYLDPNLVSTLTSGTCTLVAGADQGQGAWRSWIKIYTMSGTEVRQRSESDLDFDPKSSYMIAQVAHINCKKDYHGILSETVSRQILDGYNKLINYKLVFVKMPSEEARIEAIYIPNGAQNVRLEKDTGDPSKCHIEYSLYNGDENGFMMSHSNEQSFDAESMITLIFPSFSLFITGDLSFYADMLGMPNSSSHWCPWCLISHKQWQEPPHTFNAETRTAEFLSRTYTAIQHDTCKRLKPVDKKGVSTAMHYAGIGPEHFVPPLLHMEMGMVNQAWYQFEQWIDDEVELLPPHEKEARKFIAVAKDKLEEAAREKNEAEKTINIEIREKNGEIRLLKSELRRKTLENSRRQELNQ